MNVIYVLEDNVSTDRIYPGRYMATVLPSETPQYAFADDGVLSARLHDKSTPPEGAIVAGENFGCGSSREQAVSTLKGHGLTIIARSFARIFLQNAVNLGLNVIICPEITAVEGDELVLRGETLENRTQEKAFPLQPLPREAQCILDAGGLIPYTRAILKRGGPS